MERYFTKAHVEIRERVAEFARSELEPIARAHDESGEFPWRTMSLIGRLGLLGVPIPVELGGMGLDTLSYILVIEELAKVDASHAITVSAHTTLGRIEGWEISPAREASTASALAPSPPGGYNPRHLGGPYTRSPGI